MKIPKFIFYIIPLVNQITSLIEIPLSQININYKTPNTKIKKKKLNKSIQSKEFTNKRRFICISKFISIYSDNNRNSTSNI